MERNDYLNITTYSQLQTARQATSEELARREAALRDVRNIMIFVIRSIRSLISGTPFAKP